MRVFLIVMFLFSMLAGCNFADSKKGKQELVVKVPYEQKVTFPINFVKTKDSIIVSNLRDVVEPTISLRQNTIETDLFELTYDTLYPYGVLINKKTGPKAVAEGYWIKFDMDFRYLYGMGTDVYGVGEYHYSKSEKMLLMLDNHMLIEPKLWTVKSNSEYFNFIGHPIIVTESDDGQKTMLFNSFANDGFLSTLNIPFKSVNGTQVMLNKF